jgi:hypothetical protein
VGQAGFVARHLGEDVAVDGVVAGGGADQKNLDLGGAFGQQVGAAVVVAVHLAEFFGKNGGLDHGDAAHAPFGVGELAQQGPLDGAGGLEFVFQFGDEEVEIVEVFPRQDGGLGAQAVFEGVLG